MTPSGNLFCIALCKELGDEAARSGCAFYKPFHCEKKDPVAFPEEIPHIAFDIPQAEKASKDSRRLKSEARL